MVAPPVRYARTRDGIAVAYSVHGSGPPLLYCRGLSHLEFEWSIDQTREWYERLGEHFTVIRYDGRGSGMSDREADFWEGLELDPLAVMEAEGLEQVFFFGEGHYQSTITGLTLAAIVEHVGAAVLWCTGLAGKTPPEVNALRSVNEVNPELFVETLLLWHGWADETARGRMHELRRLSGSLEQRPFGSPEIDNRSQAAREAVTGLQVPSLVVAKRDAVTVPVAQIDEIARLMGNAERRTLGGGEVWPQLGDQEESLRVVREFLSPDSSPSRTQPGRGFATILFTDVVSSTPLLSQLRDDRMRGVMRDHDAVCEAAITEQGGRVVKTIGDAFMAEFSVPSSAIEAAIAIQRGMREQFADSDVPIRLRIGINAGEPIVENDDLHGASVVIAKRLESEADEGGILVSDLVRQAVAGKDFEFEDRGEVELKGFDQPVRAWAVRWSE